MRSGIRIACVVQQFVPEVGAGPARVLEMGRRWLERGATLTVLTGMPNRPVGRTYPGYRGRLTMEEDLEGIRVLRSWLYASPRHGVVRTLLNNLSFAVSGTINGLSRRRDYDVLIASAPPVFPHAIGAALAASKRVPLVLEFRDLWPDYLVEMGFVRRNSTGGRALFALERILLNRAAAVVVVTESFGKRLTAKGVPPDRIHVIPNGVDTELYHPAEEGPPFPGMAPIEGSPVVGYLGNFGAGQQLEAVVDAAEILRREGVSARFVLVGDGTEGHAIRRRAGELRIPGLSIHPPLPRSLTRAFYNSCDVCLVPLAPLQVLEDTVPSKLFEVLACGRPIVASVRGEAARIMEQSGAGVVVRPGDPVAIARAVRQLLSLPRSARESIGCRGVAWVGKAYARRDLADRYLALLEQLCRTPAT